MTKIVFSSLGGGLGNRLCGYINAKFLADTLSAGSYIGWTVDKSCGCSFEEIYAPGQVIVEEGWDESTKSDPEKKYLYCIHKLEYAPPFIKEIDSSSLNKEVVECRLHPGPQQLQSFKSYDEIVLTTDHTWPFITLTTQSKILLGLKLQPELQEKIDTFRKQKEIDKSVIGIHIRQTDHLSQKPLEMYFSYIQSVLNKSPEQKFFVCSDSPDAEKEVQQRFPSSVIVYPKKHYAQKYDQDKRWTAHYPARWDSTEIPEGEFGAGGYNIVRSKESVLDAVMDLYLLSYTTVSPYGAVGTYHLVATLLSLGRQ